MENLVKKDKTVKKEAKVKLKLSEKYTLLPIAISVLIIGALFISLIISPETTAKTVEDVKVAAVNVLSPFYLWVGFGAIIFCLYFCFSKYGSIRFGAEKPEYSTFSWLVMLFCAGIGSSILYWSVLEWLYYYSAPPLGAEPFSQFAAELSVTYGMFHWGITAWALYAVGAITLAQRYYIKKKSGLTLTACCEKAIGEKRANGVVGKTIDIIYLFGILGGLGTMLALGVPMLSGIVSTLFGIEDTFGLQLAMILLVTLIFLASSWSGLDKGLQLLSNCNAYLACGLVVFIFIAGPTMFQIKNITNSLGYMLQNIIHMSLWTDPIAGGGFTEKWTSFYWAWWIGLGPLMWVFTTKISKGRTMREMILGMICCGSIGCWLYFGTVSNFALFQQISGNIDLVNILQTQGPTSVINALLLSLPFGKIVLVVWFLVAVMFLATTLDSGSYTLAASTTRNLGENDNPPRMLKMGWSVLIIAVPLGFLFANASLTALQSLAVLTAVPIGILTIFTMISGYKYAKEDFGDLTASQIKEKCNEL